MFLITIAISLMWIYTFSLVYKLADEIINFKLYKDYLLKRSLTKDEKLFVKSVGDYLDFKIAYEYMLKDCVFFSIDIPTTFKDGVEVMMCLQEEV